MKRIISAILTAVTVAVLGLSGICAAAADVKDVKIDCSKAKAATNGEKSVIISSDNFKLGRITEDTQIIVTFDITDGEKSAANPPVNLAIQSMDNPTNALADKNGGVWALAVPTTYDSESAIFYYSDIVKAYTEKDFSKVDHVYAVGVIDCTIKVKSMVITDCNDKAPEVTTTTTAAETTAATTTQAATTTAAAVTQAAEPAASTGSPLILILGIVGGVIITVVIVFIIVSHKSSEAFDVSKGEFINKKDLFEPLDPEKKDEKKDSDKK